MDQIQNMMLRKLIEDTHTQVLNTKALQLELKLTYTNCDNKVNYENYTEMNRTLNQNLESYNQILNRLIKIHTKQVNEIE